MIFCLFVLVLGGRQDILWVLTPEDLSGDLWPGRSSWPQEWEKCGLLTFSQAGLCSNCIFISGVNRNLQLLHPGPGISCLTTPWRGWRPHFMYFRVEVAFCNVSAEHVSCWKDNTITFDLDTSRHYHFQEKNILQKLILKDLVLLKLALLHFLEEEFGPQEFPVVLFIFHPCSYRQKGSSFKSICGFFFFACVFQNFLFICKKKKKNHTKWRRRKCILSPVVWKRRLTLCP